jgi:hypothetical protein
MEINVGVVSELESIVGEGVAETKEELSDSLEHESVIKIDNMIVKRFLIVILIIDSLLY